MAIARRKFDKDIFDKDMNMQSLAETTKDGKMFVRGKEVFFKPKDNGYKEIKLSNGSIVSGHINAYGEIILREVKSEERKGGQVTIAKNRKIQPVIISPISSVESVSNKSDLSPEYFDTCLKSLCISRGITHVPLSDKLSDESSILKWTALDLLGQSGDLKSRIIEIIKKYTPRVDSLSWEKQSDGALRLHAKLI